MSGPDTELGDRYRCSECAGVWRMDGRPVACPHCGNEVVAGYREITIREVAVRQGKARDGDVLPEFEEVIE